jgi:hypothetical protein
MGKPTIGGTGLMKYTLNETEQRLAHYVTKQRIAYNQKTNAKPTVYTPEGLYENNLNSYGAEIAFCKLHNVFPDTDYTVRHVEDATVNGRTVDVKSTRNPSGNMNVKQLDKAERPEVYALVTGNFPHYEYVGYMDTEELITDERLTELRYNPAWVARQDELIQETL